MLKFSPLSLGVRGVDQFDLNRSSCHDVGSPRKKVFAHNGLEHTALARGLAAHYDNLGQVDVEVKLSADEDLLELLDEWNELFHTII